MHYAVHFFKFTCLHLDIDGFGSKASALRCTYVIKFTFIGILYRLPIHKGLKVDF